MACFVFTGNSAVVSFHLCDLRANGGDIYMAKTLPLHETNILILFFFSISLCIIKIEKVVFFFLVYRNHPTSGSSHFICFSRIFFFTLLVEKRRRREMPIVVATSDWISEFSLSIIIVRYSIVN